MRVLQVGPAIDPHAGCERVVGFVTLGEAVAVTWAVDVVACCTPRAEGALGTAGLHAAFSGSGVRPISQRRIVSRETSMP